MTKEQIYETIVSLTTELTPTKIGPMLFEAAKSKKGAKNINKVVKNFITQHSDLYLKMRNFATKFNELFEAGEDVEVFGNQEGRWKFDTNLIDASSFFALSFLTDIYSQYLFEFEDTVASEENIYLDAIEKESGSSELADYLRVALLSTTNIVCLKHNKIQYKYSNTSDLLADIFAGKLKEYIE